MYNIEAETYFQPNCMERSDAATKTLTLTVGQMAPTQPPVTTDSPTSSPVNQTNSPTTPIVTDSPTLSPVDQTDSPTTPTSVTDSPTLSPVEQTNIPTASPVDFEAIRINCGGDQYKDIQGRVWQADDYFTGGFDYTNTADDILGTDDDVVRLHRRNYRAERLAA